MNVINESYHTVHVMSSEAPRARDLMTKYEKCYFYRHVIQRLLQAGVGSLRDFSTAVEMTKE